MFAPSPAEVRSGRENLPNVFWKILADFDRPLALQNVKGDPMTFKTALLLLLGTAAGGWASTTYSLDPTPVTVYVGDTFTENVDLSTDQQVAGFSFDILFPTFLQVLSDPVETGFFASSGCCYYSGTIDNTNGVISGISDVDPYDNGETGTDTLVQIEFTAIATGSGQIGFQNPGLTDPDANSISIDAANPADVNSDPTPEPATWTMAALGVALVIVRHHRRSTRSSRA